MSRGYGNYSLVVGGSNFNPFQSMQEMLIPFTYYKDAYEKQEAVLDELNRNTDTFKYLEQVAKDNPESKAAQIYNTYASDLKRYGDDFSANGLSMANSRGLLNMKRRYQGEIGLLDAASKAMEEVKKSRMENKDPSMLYNEDNLNIDQFLYGKNPNLYGISGNYLYTKGAALGKAISSRIYKAGDAGSVLGGYYRNWKETRGVSQESIADFVNSDAVQQEVDNLLMAEGVKDNLTGANYEKARQQALNGLYTSIVYEESDKPVRDEGKMSAEQSARNELGWADHNLSVAAHGMVKDKNGRYVSQDEWMYTHDENGRRNGFSTEYEEAVKKGLVPGKNIKMGADGKPTTNTTTTKTGSQGSRKAKASMLFTPTGSKTVTTKDGRSLGKQITYTDAITKRPEIGFYVGEGSDLYDYWEDSKGIYVIGHGPEGQLTPETQEGAPTIIDSNHNGL